MKNLALIFVAFFYTVSYADDYPPLKEGLWQSTVNQDGKLTESKSCIGDKANLKDMFEMSKSMMQGMCDSINISKNGNSYTSKFNCNLGMTKMSVETTVSGDFEREYQISGKSTMTPPLMGQSGGVTSGKAVYIGECPSDMKPGDVLVGGKKININEMSSTMTDAMKKIDPEMLKKMQGMIKQMGERQ